MPGKHVHFDDDDAVRFARVAPSPVSTPGSTFSGSSLPSSGPRTPPYRYAPVPRVPVVIHPLLAFHAHAPPLPFDLSLPPSPTHALADSATSPPLPALLLLCHSLPWALAVHPSAAPFVSVHDVLTALYRALRLPVTPLEYNALPSHDHHAAVSTAYHTRCRRLQSKHARDEEARKGLKRIDFLMGRNRFLGLSSTKNAPDVWVLNVA